MFVRAQASKPELSYAILRDAAQMRAPPPVAPSDGILFMEQNVVLNYWNLVTANKVSTFPYTLHPKP